MNEKRAAMRPFLFWWWAAQLLLDDPAYGFFWEHRLTGEERTGGHEVPRYEEPNP